MMLRGRTSPSIVRTNYVAPTIQKRPRPTSSTLAVSSPPTTTMAGGGTTSWIPPIVLFTRGGGALSILIMKCTVGCMLFLVLIQGTMWLVNPSSTTNTSSDVHHRVAALLRGDVAKQAFELQRDAVLQSIRRLKTKSTRKSVSVSQHPICQLLPQSSTSTNKDRMAVATKLVWMNQVGAILAASQHPEDKNFVFEKWTKLLLSEISPSILEASAANNNNIDIQEQVRNSVGNVLEIVYTKLINPDTAPPLRIAVMGGSHTEGSSCSSVNWDIPEMDASSSVSAFLGNPMFCAWPFRLESFINTLAGLPLVKIVNLSEDGTDTAFMAPLVQNNIYPPALQPRGPDLILHAYRRSDYVGDNLVEIIRQELTLLLEGRSAPHPCRDRPPLVIHLDDTETDGMPILMDDLLTIQTSTAINRAMDADHQTDSGSMATHLALTWVVAFNMMDMTMQFCSKNNGATPTQSSNTIDASKTSPECPEPPKSELTETSLSSVPQLLSSPPTCPFCFFASPIGTVGNTMELQHYLKNYAVQNDGWQVVADVSTGWSRRIGLVAMYPRARILFRIPNINRPVRKFHIMTLRSNGDEWKQSKVQFRLAIVTSKINNQTFQRRLQQEGVVDEENEQEEEENEQEEEEEEKVVEYNRRSAPPIPQPTVETMFDVTGYHDLSKHVTYHFTVDLKEHAAAVGSDIMLSIELVEGSKFKILGLMLCS